MVQLVDLFGGEEIDNGDQVGVGGLPRFSRLGSELIERGQGAHGGVKEGDDARTFLAADGRFAVVAFSLAGGDGFGLLRSAPAVQRLAYDEVEVQQGGRLLLRDEALRGLAGALADFAEVAADDPRLAAEFVRDLMGGVAGEPQAFDLGDLLPLVDFRGIEFS